MCEKILFADVCAVLHRLSDPFVKPAEKLNYFHRFLRKIPHKSPVELFALLRLLTPSLDRRRPTSQLRQPLLARVYAQVFALPPAAAARLRLYKDPAAVSLDAGTAMQVGDFGSFVAATLKQRMGRRSPIVTVEELNTQLDFVCLASSLPEKTAVLKKLFPQLTVPEHKWFVRILMKEVKLGGLSGERLLTVLHPEARKIINQCSDLQSTLEVIGEQLKGNAESGGGVEQAGRRRQYGGAADAGEISDREENSTKRGEGEHLLYRPLRPMLAQLVRPATADIQLELFTGGNVGIAERGSRLYIVERKYDGERMFAHIDLTRRAKEDGREVSPGQEAQRAAAESLAACVRLFSRRGNDISKTYGGSTLYSSAHDSRAQELESEARNCLNGSSQAATHCQNVVADWELPGKETPPSNGVYQTDECNRVRRAEDTIFEGLRIMLAKALRGTQAIFDGELLAWDDERNTFLPFGTNRSVAMFETTSCHLSYVVFDILFYRNLEGKAYNLLSMQLKDRKMLLERVLKPVGSRIMLVPYVEATEAKHVIDRFNAAVQKRHEGIVVKLASSVYHLHSRRGGWYKIKPQLGCLSDTLDLIVIGAFFAQTTGRREHGSTQAIDHCSHFLLGVLEGEGGPTATRVRSFCRIGSGFSLKALAEMRELVRPYCCRLAAADPCRPAEDIHVPPWLQNCRLNSATRVDVTWPPSKSFVMEVSAAEVIPSIEFDIGFTLRFATAVRPFRRDKQWFEAMSEVDLKAFFATCEEHGGLCITSDENAAASFPPTVNDAVASAKEKVSDEETDTEDDEGIRSQLRHGLRTRGNNPLSLVTVENGGYGMHSSVSCTRGKESEGFSLGIMSPQFNVAGEFSVTDSLNTLFSSLIHATREQRPRCPINPCFGVTSRVRANAFNPLTPPVELQRLVISGIDGRPPLPPTALRGHCVWVLEGAHEGDDDDDDDELLRGRRKFEGMTDQALEPTKAALEWIVAALGGTVAPALSREVTHIIAARRTFRTEAAARAFSAEVAARERHKGAKKATHLLRSGVGGIIRPPPVLHYTWLLECARLRMLAPVRPAQVLHGTPALAREFAGRYDKYGDSFFESDCTPCSLLPLIENALANRGRECTAASELDTGRPQQESFRSKVCSQHGENHCFSGSGARNLEQEDLNFQAAELCQAILGLSDIPDLSGILLYVSPTDTVWEAPSALQALQPTAVEDSAHSRVSQSHGSDVFDSSAPTPSSVRVKETQKVTKAALIARCCARGMRLTFDTEKATHALLQPEANSVARTLHHNNDRIGFKSTGAYDFVESLPRRIEADAEFSCLERESVGGWSRTATDMRFIASERLVPALEHAKGWHAIQQVSESYFYELLNSQSDSTQQ